MGNVDKHSESSPDQAKQVIAALEEQIANLQAEAPVLSAARVARERYQKILQAVRGGNKAACEEAARELLVGGVTEGTVPLTSEAVGGPSQLTPEEYDARFRRGPHEGGGGRLEK